MLQRVMLKIHHHHLKRLQMGQRLFMRMVLKRSLLSLGCTKIFRSVLVTVKIFSAMMLMLFLVDSMILFDQFIKFSFFTFCDYLFFTLSFKDLIHSVG